MTFQGHAVSWFMGLLHETSACQSPQSKLMNGGMRCAGTHTVSEREVDNSSAKCYYQKK